MGHRVCYVISQCYLGNGTSRTGAGVGAGANATWATSHPAQVLALVLVRYWHQACAGVRVARHAELFSVPVPVGVPEFGGGPDCQA